MWRRHVTKELLVMYFCIFLVPMDNKAKNVFVLPISDSTPLMSGFGVNNILISGQVPPIHFANVVTVSSVPSYLLFD